MSKKEAKKAKKAERKAVKAEKKAERKANPSKWDSQSLRKLKKKGPCSVQLAAYPDYPGCCSSSDADDMAD